MSFVKLETLAEMEPVPGFRGRAVHGAAMTIVRWEIEAGALMPEHAHPHEQIVCLIDGELELTVGGESQTMTPGTFAVVAPDTPHSGRAVTSCRVVDCFHPVRDDMR